MATKLVSCDGSLFSNLPSHIIMDILIRLPTKSISRCRCVCKPWRNLLSGLEFADLRRVRPPSNCLMIYKSMSSFNIVECEDEPAYHDFYFLPGSRMEAPKELGPNCISMFGCTNGLICFHEFGYQDSGMVYLWNPTTCEGIAVRQSPGGVMEYPNTTTYGFGLSAKTGYYKAVRIYQEVQEAEETGPRRVSKSDCHVYTFGQGCWRYSGHAPFKYSCRTQGLFFNGNLHWLIHDPDGPELLSCFDLEKETFHPFPAPPELAKMNLATLAVYKDDYFSLCDNTSDFEITIWVMKEYGVRESWAKEFVIDKHPIDLVGEHYEVVTILKVFEDGEILLLWRDDVLISYNPKSGDSVKDVDNRKFFSAPDEGNESHDCFATMQVVEYVPSFLSLRMQFPLEMVESV